jgi:hypothetical protein
LRVPVGNPALIGLDIPLTTLDGVAGRRKILTCTQINKNNKRKSLSDYAQQELSVMEGGWIARCGEMRNLRCTVRSVPLLQEIVRYEVNQYLYKIGKKIAYMKIFTYIIEMIYCIHSL